MKSFKTIKIAVLSSLMLNLAMPMQAGIKQSIISFAKKADGFAWKTPARALGLIFGGALVGGGIGHWLDKKAERNLNPDKALIRNVLARIQDNNGNATNLLIDTDINQLVKVKIQTKTELRQLIDQYNQSIRLNANLTDKEAARRKLAQRLQDVSAFELTSNSKGPQGMLLGSLLSFLFMVAAQEIAKK